MNKVISLTWYIEPPIDFEHKQYILLAYLHTVDGSFMQKKLSPHFLYLEKVLNELNSFNKSFDDMSRSLDKNKYIFFANDHKIDNGGEKLLYEIKDIIDFSIPQIETRIDFGRSILKKYSQILF
jgi:hypothetical protein